MQVSLLYPFVCGFDIYVSNVNVYTDTGTENLSEYELLRLQNIARNNAKLKALGLLKEQINPPKTTQRKRKPKDPVSPSRVSKRLKGLEPDGKTIISKDTSEDTSSRPPVQEQQSLLPISDNDNDGSGDDFSEYTQESDLSCCSSEEEEETYERQGKRRRLQYGWELPFSQLQDIDDDDGTELELWKRMFKQLVKYKSEHGHASPSLNDSKNKELAIWTYEQRIINNDGMLDETRKKCLLLIGFILKSTANGTPNSYGDKREAVSVYCAKTGVLLENCISIKHASPNLRETVGQGILSDWNKDNRGQDREASAQDIKNAGPNGLDVGNCGTLDEPQRVHWQ